MVLVEASERAPLFQIFPSLLVVLLLDPSSLCNIPRPPRKNKDDEIKHNQPNFLSIPLEIRRAIYTAAFTPLGLHRLTRSSRLRNAPCFGANLGKEPVRSRCPQKSKPGYRVDAAGEVYLSNLNPFGVRILNARRRVGTPMCGLGILRGGGAVALVCCWSVGRCKLVCHPCPDD